MSSKQKKNVGGRPCRFKEPTITWTLRMPRSKAAEIKAAIQAILKRYEA